MDNPRETLAELTSLLMRELGDRLIGLYLFGSLASGTFHDGKSDLDVFAVIAREIEEGDQFDALASLHTAFVSAHPSWTERIEVGYVSHAVLQSFTEVPSGRIAAISPGEPFHLREVGTAGSSTGTASAHRARFSPGLRRLRLGRSYRQARSSGPLRPNLSNGKTSFARRRSGTYPPSRATS